MGNGADEPIQFTRNDADRLTRVEDTILVIKRILWVIVTTSITGLITGLLQLLDIIYTKG